MSHFIDLSHQTRQKQHYKPHLFTVEHKGVHGSLADVLDVLPSFDNAHEQHRWISGFDTNHDSLQPLLQSHRRSKDCLEESKEVVHATDRANSISWPIMVSGPLRRKQYPPKYKAMVCESIRTALHLRPGETGAFQVAAQKFQISPSMATEWWKKGLGYFDHKPQTKAITSFDTSARFPDLEVSCTQNFTLGAFTKVFMLMGTGFESSSKSSSRPQTETQKTSSNTQTVARWVLHPVRRHFTTHYKQKGRTSARTPARYTLFPYANHPFASVQTPGCPRLQLPSTFWPLLARPYVCG